MNIPVPSPGPDPSKYQKPSGMSVGYTIKPWRGAAMAPRCPAVRRGMSRPQSVARISSAALVSGLAVPISTWTRPASGTIAEPGSRAVSDLVGLFC